MKKLCFILTLFLSCFYSHAQFLGLNWVYGVGNTGWDRGHAIQVGPYGNIYSVGIFSGNVDIDPGSGSWDLNTSAGIKGVYIKKVDAYGNLLWARQITDGIVTDSLSGEILDVDRLGNMYLVGQFRGTVDFDPGPNTFTLSNPAGSQTDMFILKLDADGNFLWAKQTGGTAYEKVVSINLDPSGNLFCTGRFYGTVDFDPGSGTSNLTANSGGDVFIQKLTASGNLIWVKSIGNNNANSAFEGIVDRQGNVIVSGLFSGQMDFDPGSGTYIQTSYNNLPDIFTVKFDRSGNFLWASYIGSPTIDYKGHTTVDTRGNVYVTGAFSGAADFNPGRNSITLTSSDNGIVSFYDGYLQKLNSQGVFQWVRHFKGASMSHTYMEPGNIATDLFGNAYITGYNQGRIDFDPGMGVDIHSGGFVGKNFMIKISIVGDYIWGKSIGSSDDMLFEDMSLDSKDNIYLTGGFPDTLDFDPGPSRFSLTPSSNRPDIFVAKWSQDSCSSLAAIVDRTLGIGCTSSGFASGFASEGKAPYTYEWNTIPASTDTFANFTKEGLYEFTVTGSDGCSRTSNFLIAGPTNNTGQDLAVNITSSRFRTGFPASILIDAFNDGCAPTSGEVRVVLDPLLSLDNSYPQPDTIIGNTLIWHVSNMFYDMPHFIARIEVTVSTQAMIGDQICLDADISPKANDSNTKNNIRDYCRPVNNSYDPNDKLVSPQGLCPEGYVVSGEAFTYTVRFQNTGNADAINIFILDTLDAHLDMSSLKVVAQSHKPMITEVLPDRVLKFRFDNIHLPDSTTNEKQSHGYVIFEVYPMANIASGTRITNTAGIYFDFNEAILTNTVLNTLVDTIPILDTTFLQATGCNDYTLNRRTYTASGTYFQKFTGLSRCERVISLSLVLQPVDTSVSLIDKTLISSEGGAHGLNTEYQWVDCDNGNSPISGATNQSFTPESNGNYAVIVNQGDCTEMSACHYVSVVGVDPDFQAELVYYPNPSTGTFKIEFGSYYASPEILIINTVGQLIDREEFGLVDKVSIRMPDQAGLYFVQVKAEDRVAVLKVLKK